MRKLNYHLVDVFTNEMFGGNQLAVFTDCENLPASYMQKIAKELNLAESTFVLPPKDSSHDHWVRIFTPATELPMAGHPTVGTAFVLVQQDASLGESQQLRFMEGVGVIPVHVQIDNGATSLITMQQPLPEFGSHFTDRQLMADILSLKIDAIDPNTPCEVVSTGLPFLFVPITSLDEIRRIRLRLDLWEQALKGFEAPQIFVFTQETERADSTVHSRMFAPALGIMEDPATGSASGPLGSYLVKHGLVSVEDATEIVSEQGFEMGRPSIIRISISQENNQISRVTVGGECVAVGAGYINLNVAS